MKDKHILLHVTGSISCYKACELTSLLVKQGAEVQVTMSCGALKFLQPAVFEGLSRREALTPDMFARKPDCIPHITLAQSWADLIIIYPASANCIARLASGLSDDLFGATFLANNFEKPVLLAPAMNSNMFAHPATQENLKKLESWGTKILPTEEGRLACGSVGLGKLISPERTLDFIRENLK
ncbi:MAG: flavoprotein [Treponema sp.]|uniref:flavoprotein n=1 Tax=Treponema sp. TaxID=166 RepID=UPI0025F7531C|nr:flavoprotein [Treponema sp.]MBR0496457.1 flavoprotein [Treponema sp.]